MHTRQGSYDFSNSEDISKLFLDIRDEAHRFALKNYRTKKSKDLKQHFLLDIKGVGPKIVQKIYKEFKSLKPIANLEIKEISKTISINEDLAKKIQKAIKGIYN